MFEEMPCCSYPGRWSVAGQRGALDIVRLQLSSRVETGRSRQRRKPAKGTVAVATAGRKAKMMVARRMGLASKRGPLADVDL